MKQGRGISASLTAILSSVASIGCCLPLGLTLHNVDLPSVHEIEIREPVTLCFPSGDAHRSGFGEAPVALIVVWSKRFFEPIGSADQEFPEAASYGMRISAFHKSLHGDRSGVNLSQADAFSVGVGTRRLRSGRPPHSGSLDLGQSQIGGLNFWGFSGHRDEDVQMQR